MVNVIDKYIRFNIPYKQNTNLKSSIIINCIPQTKSESKYIIIHLLLEKHKKDKHKGKKEKHSDKAGHKKDGKRHKEENKDNKNAYEKYLKKFNSSANATGNNIGSGTSCKVKFCKENFQTGFVVAGAGFFPIETIN